MNRKERKSAYLLAAIFFNRRNGGKHTGRYALNELSGICRVLPTIVREYDRINNHKMYDIFPEIETMSPLGYEVSRFHPHWFAIEDSKGDQERVMFLALAATMPIEILNGECHP